MPTTIAPYNNTRRRNLFFQVAVNKLIYCIVHNRWSPLNDFVSNQRQWLLLAWGISVTLLSHITDTNGKRFPFRPCVSGKTQSHWLTNLSPTGARPRGGASSEREEDKASSPGISPVPLRQSLKHTLFCQQWRTFSPLFYVAFVSRIYQISWKNSAFYWFISLGVSHWAWLCWQRRAGFSTCCFPGTIPLIRNHREVWRVWLLLSPILFSTCVPNLGLYKKRGTEAVVSKL